jgi:N utilization substance protein A
VVNELRGEKVDVVQWRDDLSQFIAEALGPAKVKEVNIDEDEKTADVIVSEHQLSLAIGKEGQNARLAARLSGYKVDIRSDAEPAEETEAKETKAKETEAEATGPASSDDSSSEDVVAAESAEETAGVDDASSEDVVATEETDNEDAVMDEDDVVEADSDAVVEADSDAVAENGEDESE